MTSAGRQRFYFVLTVVAALALAVALAALALRDNLSYFVSPSEVIEMRVQGHPRVADGKIFRLGGLVEAGSVKQDDKNPRVSFTVTDGAASIRVEYRGILPDLFREGQGVVATGALDAEGVFVAAQLLAKHDENYMPPEVAKSLKRAHEKGRENLQIEGAK